MKLLTVEMAYDGHRIATRWEVTSAAATAGLLPRSLGATFWPCDDLEEAPIMDVVLEHLETVLVQVVSHLRRKGEPLQQLAFDLDELASAARVYGGARE